jgi:uncharacterized protein VirK/YbjX
VQWTSSRDAQFDVSYAQFWKSLSGRSAGPYGYLIDLPMRMTPLDALDAKARKRAVARRMHIEAVEQCAMQAVSRFLSAACSPAR